MHVTTVSSPARFILMLRTRMVQAVALCKAKGVKTLVTAGRWGATLKQAHTTETVHKIAFGLLQSYATAVHVLLVLKESSSRPPKGSDELEGGLMKPPMPCSNEKVQQCLKHGADWAFNYKTEDWAARVKEAAQPAGVNVILDCVGWAPACSYAHFVAAMEVHCPAGSDVLKP